MSTIILNIENHSNYNTALYESIELLSKSQVVALPTETVYGLAANAFDHNAVAKIYDLKNRPADNPLILHAGNIEQLLSLISKDFYDIAQKINESFWPGPLTIVVPKSEIVPNWLTRELKTVAVRIPDSKIMRDIALAIKSPLAAPSANLSGRPSPTRASHVLQDFNGQIELIVDNGPTNFGLESTVIDITDQENIVILRPGAITKLQIELALNVNVSFVNKVESTVKSPGIKYKHYAPSCDVKLITYKSKADFFELISSEQLNNECFVIKPIDLNLDFENVYNFIDIDDLSRNIFDLFRTLENSYKKIVVAYPEQYIEAAVYNRLLKAAGL